MLILHRSPHGHHERQALEGVGSPSGRAPAKAGERALSVGLAATSPEGRGFSGARSTP